MGPAGKREYVEAVAERYGRVNRAGKKRVLDEYCRLVGCHRKSAIRTLNGLRRKKESAGCVKSRRRGPGRVYGEAECEALKAIWLAAEQPCGKRLVAAIPLWLPSYEKRKKLEKRPRERLLRISASTADRVLKDSRARLKGKGLGGTRPGSLLKTQIPIRGECWDEKRPGYMEADTVAHCGDSLNGSFVWSLTFTDISSGWTVNAAVWNKGAGGVKEKVAAMEGELPFKLLGFDCDNGSEFLNHHLWNYMRQRKEPVDFTRSRPYRKNDQAHVEQKNWTHVRQLLGYERLERAELVEPINELYRWWGLLHNYFCPMLKLKEKVREGARVKRSYEKPATAYQRLLESPEVSAKSKMRLRKQFKELDPFDVKHQIEARLKGIFEMKRRLECGSKSTNPISENRQPHPVPFGNTLP
jgi:hypothetical protein